MAYVYRSPSYVVRHSAFQRHPASLGVPVTLVSLADQVENIAVPQDTQCWINQNSITQPSRYSQINGSDLCLMAFEFQSFSNTARLHTMIRSSIMRRIAARPARGTLHCTLHRE